MSETVRYLITAVLFLLGIVSAAISMLGVYRFKFVMNRMHCAAILDTVSMACILVGLMVLVHSWSFVPKLIAVLFVLWVSSPVASHIVGRMEIDTDETVSEHIQTGEEKENGSH
ncbi:MAG: monovalent cation/H(+) antiporter subunit G [Clostridia bacterium]|nr:monovalent cation/H(+) antiporter subunit G [Clostridia bacterium]